MPDLDVIKKLEQKVGRPFRFELDGERCVGLDLTSEQALFGGLIRHHSTTEKQEILELVCRLKDLRSLNLRRNLLLRLPEHFRELVRLERLTLGSNALGEIPSILEPLKKLKYLHLGNNHLAEVPEFMAGFLDLEYLALHKNVRVKSVEPLSNLKQVRALNLHYLNLHRIPEFIFQLRHLQSLTLWNISEIPDEIAGLQELEFFSACGAPGLRALPDGFTRLKKLRMTRLFQNRLESLPERIGDLSRLEQISLYQNRLHHLPDSFARLTHLRKLNLGWNEFKTLPACLGRFPVLEWLGIFENPLKQTDLSFLPPHTRVDRVWPFSTTRPAEIGLPK
jgi:Leucine-rich repeat (LRR) protein